MEILPFGNLDYPDKAVFGTNLYNLSQLKRLGFSVPKGVAVSPPEIILQSLLEHIKNKNTEQFEQSLTLIKKEILKIPISEDLELNLKGHRMFFLTDKIYTDRSELWKKMLEVWVNEIRERIWHAGFDLRLTQNLSPQSVFFIDNQFETGTAFFDPEKDETVIAFKNETVNKNLSPQTLHAIDQMVILANKKLYIPQVFELLETKNKIFIISLKPFTESLPLAKAESIIIPKAQQKKIVKSATKIFLNLANGFAIDPNIDGLLIEAEHSRDFEELVFRLAEGALSYPGKSVLFKLPEALLHDKKSFDGACEALLFVRNKKTLLNLELVIPAVNSLAELLEIKRELLSRSITRKGSLKIWIEMAIPENLINAENYLESGIDGILLNLDRLQELLIDIKENQPDLYKIHVQTINKFLTPSFKIFHSLKIPIIAKGSLTLHPDMLDFLVEKGCFGIIANTLAESESLPAELNFQEKRIFLKRI